MPLFAYCALAGIVLVFGFFFGVVMNNLYMHIRSGLADFRECNIPGVRNAAIVFAIFLGVASVAFGCISFGLVVYVHIENLDSFNLKLAHAGCVLELVGAFVGCVLIRQPTDFESVRYHPMPKPLFNIRRWQLF